MCSNASAAGKLAAGAADVAAQLAMAIDECAAAARRPGRAAETDLAGRLAAVWAILTAADPELAACTARYAGS
jgi:hypothetical protein